MCRRRHSSVPSVSPWCPLRLSQVSTTARCPPGGVHHSQLSTSSTAVKDVCLPRGQPLCAALTKLFTFILFLFSPTLLPGGTSSSFPHGDQREAKAGGDPPEDAPGDDESSRESEVLRLRPARPDLRQHDGGLVRLHHLLGGPVSVLFPA